MALLSEPTLEAGGGIKDGCARALFWDSLISERPRPDEMVPGRGRLLWGRMTEERKWCCCEG